MKLRVFWIASILFAICAIGVDVKSQNEASNGMKFIAQSVMATNDQKEVLKAEAKRCAHQSDELALAGLCVAIGSAVCLVVSVKQHEPARRSIPFVLLVLYVLLQLMLI